MVESIARVRHIRVTPQKARRVVDLIRGKQAAGGPGHPEVRAAGRERADLQARRRRRSRTLASRPTPAKYLDEQDLYVANAYVDEGTTLKRFQPRAQGRAFQIKKRTSHITVVLATPEAGDAGPPPPRRKKASK